MSESWYIRILLDTWSNLKLFLIASVLFRVTSTTSIIRMNYYDWNTLLWLQWIQSNDNECYFLYPETYRRFKLLTTSATICILKHKESHFKVSGNLKLFGTRWLAWDYVTKTQLEARRIKQQALKGPVGRPGKIKKTTIKKYSDPTVWKRQHVPEKLN